MKYVKNKAKMSGIIICAVLGIFLCGNISGQELVRVGNNYFSTGLQKLSCGIASDKVISINSAVNLSGTLIIKAEKGEMAGFNFKKVLKVDSESEAVDYARAIDVKLEKTSTGCVLILQAPNPAPWQGSANSGNIEGELTLPENCRIEIDARYFDLEVEGPFIAVKNTPSFGRLEATKISELLSLTTSNQDITVQNIAGEISLITSHANIDIIDMKTSMQPALIENENGDINGENLRGVFDIKNDFGRIKLNNIKLISDRSRISGSYSPIQLNIVGINNGGLTVRNTNEDIKVNVAKSLSAEFSLRVDSDGEIDVEDLPVKPILIDSNRMDFITGEGGPKIRMSIRNEGNINIQGE